MVFNRTNNTRGELWWNEVAANPTLNGSILSIEILRTLTRDPIPMRNPYLNSSTPADNTALVEISHRRLVSYNAITDDMQERVGALGKHLPPVSFNDDVVLGRLPRGKHGGRRIFSLRNTVPSPSEETAQTPIFNGYLLGLPLMSPAPIG